MSAAVCLPGAAFLRARRLALLARADSGFAANHLFADTFTFSGLAAAHARFAAYLWELHT